MTATKRTTGSMAPLKRHEQKLKDTIGGKNERKTNLG